MKKYLLVLAFFCTGICMTKAQTTEASVQPVILQLMDHYNAGEYDSICDMFSQEAKVQLPPAKTKAFLTQMKTGYGSMKALRFREFQSGLMIYNAAMEKGRLSLAIAVSDRQEITALYARPYNAATDSIMMERNVTPMYLPFTGTWTVFWGGDTKELNYHVATPFQKNAFDLIVHGDNNKSFKTDGKSNEDYYAFGREITAPCDATVVLAVDGIKDNIPGELNPLYAPGNAVLLKAAGGEYMLLAHLKQYTVKVKQGQTVKRGQLLGLCGNSGNSSEPHLHFHLQDQESFSKARGVKCYFNQVKVDGVVMASCSPVKGNQISAGE